MIGALLVACLVGGFFYASHYQPLVLRPEVSMGSPPKNGVEWVLQQSNIVDNGPFGVTVVSADRGKVSASPREKSLRPGTLCRVSKKYPFQCVAAMDGRSIPAPFHVFSLGGGGGRPMLWTFSYDCRLSSIPSPQIMVPVGMRFLWFSHTENLTSSTSEATSC